MASEIVAVCDYIVDYLSDNFVSGDNVDIERTWEFVEDLGTFEGKKIDVCPPSYVRNAPVTRGEDSLDVSILVVIRERYQDASSVEKAVPTSWVDDKVEFVENKVFSVLASPRIIHEIPVGSGTPQQYWCQTATVGIVWDYTRLTQQKTFWSECEFVFRKLLRG